MNMSDITPVALCIATQDLFDAKRFRSNFCDNLLLRMKDVRLEGKIQKLKRELNSVMTEKNFLDGHKTAIISNVDKIMALVTSRYSQMDLRLSENIVRDGKELIDKVILAENFEQIASLEWTFKSKITIPVFELFTTYMKKSKAV